MSSKIDLESVKILADIMKPQPQTQAQPAQDRDSFAGFTSGISRNQYIIFAIISAVMWIVSGMNDGKNINSIQTSQITANTQAIEKVTAAVESLAKSTDADRSAQQIVNVQLLNSNATIQKDIEAIKNKPDVK